MSNFNHYAVELDTAVKEYRNRFHEAEKAVKDAKKAYDKAREESRPAKSLTPVEKINQESRVLRYQARYEEAVASLREVTKDRFSLLTTADKLRSQLAEDVNRAYCADPAAIDRNVMTLLDSGILTAREMRKLVDDAKEAGNPTMCRIIKEYANKTIKENEKRWGVHDPELSDLNYVVDTASKNDGRFILGEFDNLKTCLTYITGDPNGEYHRDIGTGVLDRWEEITSQAVEEF